MSAPDGWDDQPDEATIAGAREVRKLFLALQTVGFTMSEAAHIVAAMMAANNQVALRSKRDEPGSS